MPTRIINERDVENPCVAYARKNGVVVVKQTHAGARSWPDRAFYFQGGHLLQIEFKAPTKLPTPQQAHTIADLRARGFDVQIVDNKKDGIALIEDRYANGWRQNQKFDKFTCSALKTVLGRITD